MIDTEDAGSVLLQFDNGAQGVFTGFTSKRWKKKSFLV